MAYYYSSNNRVLEYNPLTGVTPDNYNEIITTRQKRNLVVGQIYSLKGVNCDGFEMKEKEYKVIAFVDSLHGISIDSVIMKQVGGDEDGLKFTLTKADCVNLNIEFQNGLELFPINLGWTKPKRILEEEQKKKAEELAKFESFKDEIRNLVDDEYQQWREQRKSKKVKRNSDVPHAEAKWWTNDDLIKSTLSETLKQAADIMMHNNFKSMYQNPF